VSVYHVNELSLELPDDYSDRSYTVLTAASGDISINITRDDLKIPEGETLASVVNKQLKRLARDWPRFFIIDQRDKEVGGLACREARLQWIPERVLMYQHQIYVPYYGTLITITASAQKKHAAQCDAYLRETTDGMKFRKQLS
jgi:hypothetical protein